MKKFIWKLIPLSCLFHSIPFTFHSNLESNSTWGSTRHSCSCPQTIKSKNRGRKCSFMAFLGFVFTLHIKNNFNILLCLKIIFYFSTLVIICFKYYLILFITCFDEAQECWTNLTLDSFLELQVASIVQHVESIIIHKQKRKLKRINKENKICIIWIRIKKKEPETFYLDVHLLYFQGHIKQQKWNPVKVI